jgi:hypothetical protein
MKDHVRQIDKLRYQPAVEHAVDVILAGGMVLDTGNILHAASGKIVQDEDLVSVVNETFGKVGSNEAGATRN